MSPAATATPVSFAYFGDGSDAYFAGGSVTSDVPQKWPVAFDGHSYMVDTQVEHIFSDYWAHETIQLTRTQADTSQEPAETTLNPEAMWRRAQDSWHLGSGQQFRDRSTANTPVQQFRYNTSKGVNPWTRYELSLLLDTHRFSSSANTNLHMAVAGSNLYWTDGQVLKFTGDLSATTSVTGNPGVTPTAVTSDGHTIYTAYGASGIYTTTSGSASQSSAVTGTVSLIQYVMGRIMVTNGAAIYNVVTLSGALPSALFTQANSDFAWVGFCDGPQGMYAAGFSGDKSIIYRIPEKSDGSGLDVPKIAATLPSGEIVRAVYGYLGFVAIGTDKGWRLASPDSTGFLTYGPLVATPNPVRAFDAQDRFIWYALESYDTSSTGVGRMDISAFTDTLVPAYASDLMVTAQAQILDIKTFRGSKIIAVSGSGIWTDTAATDHSLVASGTLDSGLIGFGLPDIKTSMYVDIRTNPLAGSYAVALAADQGSFLTLGTQGTAGTTGQSFPTNQTRAELFETRVTLTRSSGDTTTGPVILRRTLKAFPAPQDGPFETIRVPIMLYHELADGTGAVSYMDVEDERERFDTLRATRRIITYQEFSTSYVGYVNDFTWVPIDLRYIDGKYTYDGTMIVNFVRLQ